MLSSKVATRRILRKESSKRKHTLRFPLTNPLRDLRVAKCRVALLDAARMVIETGFTRDRAMDWFDDLLVGAAVEAFPKDVHLAALMLEVPDNFIKTRWNGLKK